MFPGFSVEGSYNAPSRAHYGFAVAQVIAHEPLQVQVLNMKERGKETGKDKDRVTSERHLANPS
jgi:hypothetical protein